MVIGWTLFLGAMATGILSDTVSTLKDERNNVQSLINKLEGN